MTITIDEKKALCLSLTLSGNEKVQSGREKLHLAELLRKDMEGEVVVDPEPDPEPDEVVAALRYVAALAPAFATDADPGRTGALEVVATDPADRFVVEVSGSVAVHDGPAPEGAFVLRGRATDLLESLTLRQPMSAEIPETHRWLFDPLKAVFSEQ